jgi:hypothetical protein
MFGGNSSMGFDVAILHILFVTTEEPVKVERSFNALYQRKAKHCAMFSEPMQDMNDEDEVTTHGATLSRSNARHGRQGKVCPYYLYRDC